MIIYTDNGPVVVPGQADPPIPFPRPSSRRGTQFNFTWIGSDGTEWPLCGGPVWMLTGARGFGMPSLQHWEQQHLGHGATWRGLRVPPREVLLPVEVAARDGEFIDTEQVFFDGIDPYTEGTLRVTTPGGTFRDLRCRYIEGAEGEIDPDALLYNEARYPLKLRAYDPFWHGEPIFEEFAYQTDTAARPTFPGPPFHRRLANALEGEGEVTNPGDIESYPLMVVDAPFTGFSVGIGASTVDMTLTKQTGAVTIDTTSGRMVIRDEAGVDLWEYADAHAAPIPPKSTTTLKTMVQGPGPGSKVTIKADTNYYRAWGTTR